MDFSSSDATDRPRSAQANLLWHCRQRTSEIPGRCLKAD